MRKYILVAAAMLSACVVHGATKTVVVNTDFTHANLLRETVDGRDYVSVIQDGLGPCIFQPGAPSLPGFVEVVELPNGGIFNSSTVDIEWQTFATDIVIYPVQPPVVGTETNPPFTAPDPAIYELNAFFSDPNTEAYVTVTRGVKSVSVPVCPYRYNPVTKILEAAKQVTISVDYTQGPVSRKKMSAADKIDYVLIAPPDYYENWCDYVAWRASTRPGMKFLCKNAQEIYNAYPNWRNDAERIHAYLRDMLRDHEIEYVVLAGAWYDCQNPKGRYLGGEALGPNNAIPGVYVRSSGDQPSDYFYACLDLCGGTYPWDKNGNGIYGEEYGSNIDISPDIVVSRISFKPSKFVAAGMTIPEMIAAYTNKIARVEAADFSGNHRFSMNFESFTADKTLKQMTMADRDSEFKYFDGKYNIYDPRNGGVYCDTEMSTRFYVRDGIAAVLPIGSAFINKVSDARNTNTELIFARSHGQTYYAAGFLSEQVAVQTGLTKIFAAQSPCLSGYPDVIENNIIIPSLAETFVQNPNGGSVCSIANGRVGYYQNSASMQTFEGDIFSKECETGFFRNFIEGTNSIGKLWKAQQTTVAAKPIMNSNMHSRWCLYNEFLYGDPLTAFARPEHYTANPNRRMNGLESAENSHEITTGGGTGRFPFRFTGARGSLTLNAAEEYYVGGIENAREVVFRGNNAILDLTKSADVDALVFANGSSGTTLRSKTRGQLASYLPLSLKNASVVLETSEAGGNTPSTTPFAVLDEGALTFKPNPNNGLDGEWEYLLRPVVMTNGTLTADYITTLAFGSPAHPGTVRLDVSGNSRLNTTNGGAFKLYGTTEVALNSGSRLQIDADILDNDNGKLRFTGNGSVQFVSASGAAGTLEIGPGVTAIFDSLPFAHLTNLVVGANAKIVLPSSDSDFWQITPLKNCKFSIDDSVTFYENGSDEPIDGTLTTGGAYFRKGAVLEWNAVNGVWGESDSYKPWILNGVTTNYVSNLGIYFGNLNSASATVEVEGAMVSTAASFANSATSYQFVRKANDDYASLVFTKLLTGGDFSAELPISTVNDIDVMGGEFNCNATNYPAVAASEVTIRDGASFSVSSIYSTIPSIRGFRVLFTGSSGSSVDVIEIYTKIAGRAFGNKKGGFGSIGGTLFDSNGNNATNLGYLIDGKSEPDLYIPPFISEPGDPRWSSPFTAGETYFGVSFSRSVPVPSYFNLAANGSNKPTRYSFQVTQDGANYTTLVDCSPSYQTTGGWQGANSVEGGGIWMSAYRRKTKVNVEAGGALLARGSYYADLDFAAGSILKAVAGSDGITLESGSTIALPQNGKISVDTSALNFSQNEQFVLIKQPGWVTADLKHFTVDNKNTELRLVNGDLCVVAVDGDIQPPYLLGVCGSVNWNTNQWYWYDDSADEDQAWKQFTKAWGAYNTKQSGEAQIDLCGDAILNVDTDVVIDIVCACKTNNQPVANLTLTSSNNSRLTAQTLDFSIFPGDITLDIPGISGTLSLPGGTLNIARPATNATLKAGSSGKISLTGSGANQSVLYPLIKVADVADVENLTLTGAAANLSLLTVGNIVFAIDMDEYRRQLGEGQDPLNVTLPTAYYNFEFENNLDQTNSQASLALSQDGNVTASYVDSRSGKAMINAKHYTAANAFQLGGEAWTVSSTIRLTDTDNQVAFAIGPLSSAGLALTSKSANEVSLAYWYNGGAHENLIEATVQHASSQFHNYIIRVNGALVELFVDGSKKGEGRLADGHLVSGNTAFQFHSVHGGMPGGLNNAGSAIALDNFSLYRSALSELEILKLSNLNPAWPEVLMANLSAGNNGEWSQLNWYYNSGAAVGTIDWNTVNEVIFVARDDAEVELSFLPSNAFSITVEGGGKVTYTIPSGTTFTTATPDSGKLVNGLPIRVEGVLDITYTNQQRTENADWSNLSGNGTVRVRYASGDAADGNWFTIPVNFFANTLSLDLQGVGILTENSRKDFRNLTGSGSFRGDWGSANNDRGVRTVQTKTTTWSGHVVNDSGSNRAITISVASDGNAPSAAKALNYTGSTTSSQHKFNIESNGYLIMNGTWNGSIVNNGELEISTSSESGAYTIPNSISGNGLICASGNGTLQLATSSTFKVADATTATIVITGVNDTVSEGEIISVEPGFDVARHNIVLKNGNGDVLSGLSLAVSDDGKLCYTSGNYYTTVSATPARWSALTWRNEKGEPVNVADWSRVPGIVVTGAVANAALELDVALNASASISFVGNNALSIAGNGALASNIATEIPLTINGDVLPYLNAFEQSDASAVLTIANGATVATLPTDNSNWCLNGRTVVIEDGGRLEIGHNAALNLQSLSWKNITGSGTVAFTGGKDNNWVIPPAIKDFCSTLSFENNTLIKPCTWSGGSAMNFRNLSGDGDFSGDLGEIYTRVLKSTQTRQSCWSGILRPATNTYHADGQTVWLEVYGSESTPAIERSLELSGTQTSLHKLTIAASGYVRLSGAWFGPIVNNGVLRYEPAAGVVATTNNCDISGSGRISFGGAGTLKLDATDEFTLAADSNGRLEITGVTGASGELLNVENGFTLDGKEIVLTDGNGEAIDNVTLSIANGKLCYRVSSSNGRSLKLLIK